MHKSNFFVLNDVFYSLLCILYVSVCLKNEREKGTLKYDKTRVAVKFSSDSFFFIYVFQSNWCKN